MFCIILYAFLKQLKLHAFICSAISIQLLMLSRVPSCEETCQKYYRACLIDQVTYYYSGYERITITTPTKLILDKPSAHLFCSVSFTCDISSDDAYSNTSDISDTRQIIHHPQMMVVGW